MKIKLTLFLITLFWSAYSQDSIQSYSKKWYVPTYGNTQFAGNIGMISLGAGWSNKTDKLSITPSFGYVPKFDGDRPILIFTLKGLYTPPLKVSFGKIEIEPFSIGTVLSHTFGRRFSRFHDRDRYPKGYYWWSVPVRFGFVHQVNVSAPIKCKYVKKVELYFETSYWDLDFFSQFNNLNDSELKLSDVLIFGIGANLYIN